MKKIVPYLMSALVFLIGAMLLYSILYVIFWLFSFSDIYLFYLFALWNEIASFISNYLGDSPLVTILSFFVMLLAVGIILMPIRFLFIKLREIFFGE